MIRVFIAEKPSLAKAIAAGLGDVKSDNGFLKIGDDIVTWCYGHILEQYEPEDYDVRYKERRMADLPIIPVEWKLKVKADASKQFHIIKDLIAKADCIVNAGDPDREGQLLVDEVLEYLENTKPVKRILVNALDDKSVRDALNDLRNNADFQGLKNSALARSRADWLIGMNLSRAFSIKAREAGYTGLNVGRVLTPTMSLVVRREDEICNFKPTTHYQIEAMWQHKNGFIPTVWKPNENSDYLDSEGRILKQQVCDELINTLRALKNNVCIKSVEQTKKQEGQRLPYSLSTLQIDAGKKFGFSPQVVLDTMQELYEKKLTTYPRSDCEFLPENQLADSEKILSNIQTIESECFNELVAKANLSIRSRAWNNKKISAHHALIPTTVKCDFNELTPTQQKLYMLVAKAYLAQFYPIHTYTATKICIMCNEELFVGTGKTIMELGWKEIYTNTEKDDKKEESILPAVLEKDDVSFIAAKIITKQTKPPSRFNPSTLLKAMKEIHKFVHDESLKKDLKECSGIGTEATRAGIIEKLQKAGFMTLSDKVLVPTDKAKMAVQILPVDITYPDTTSLLERELESIVDGKSDLNTFFTKQTTALNKIIAEAKLTKIEMAKNAVICPVCHKAMVRIESKKKKGSFFWGCSGMPDCKTIAPEKNGKPDFEAANNQTLSAACPKCGQKIYQRKGPYGAFWACSNKECNLKLSDFKDKPVIYKCPKCSNGFLVQRKGSKGMFWGCTQFNQDEKCDAIYKDEKGLPLMRN